MITRPKPGDVVYLVPTLHTAPGAAYRHPRVVVVDVIGPRVTVRLLDGGQEITTDERNITRHAPTGPRHRTARQPVRPPMPDGFQEVTLW